jgi:nitroimidazol reductase NimA-like FMN-containing flavoprotein (pyridoxamine 5'-phosphate oxidase superfamily)
MVTLHRSTGALTRLPRAPFDVAAFLARPLVARVAALAPNRPAPTVRPVWYLWEEETFWVLTGHWSRLGAALAANPAFALVIDSCDPATGQVLQVTATGRGMVVPFEAGRARRKLRRYLGPNEDSWDPRFRPGQDPAAPGVRWARLVPDRLDIRDLSFRPAPPSPL